MSDPTLNPEYLIKFNNTLSLPHIDTNTPAPPSGEALPVLTLDAASRLADLTVSVFRIPPKYMKSCLPESA